MKKPQASKPKKLIKPGTIWQLGEHRLAYGDCRDKELLQKLLGKEKVALVCCDPPYGVAVVESKRGFKTLTMDKIISNDITFILSTQNENGSRYTALLPVTPTCEG